MSSKLSVEPANHQVEYEAVGGKKKKSLSSSKSPKSSKSKQQQQEQVKSKKSKQDSKTSKSKSSKKGGALVADVKNLAVPFAILLAKEGLSKMFKQDASKSSKSLSSSSASKPSSSRRRTTLSGGSCNLGCTAQTGGQAAKQLFELQNEIDRFLEKY